MSLTKVDLNNARNMKQMMFEWNEMKSPFKRFALNYREIWGGRKLYSR